jgi:hypothetical protein
MADFVQSSQTRNAVRELANPIAYVSAFNLIVQSVINDNLYFSRSLLLYNCISVYCCASYEEI